VNKEISTLQIRMAQGGDWKLFRDEISNLIDVAESQEEYISLLQAYANLIAVGPSCYDEETWEKMHPITQGEYKFFLIKESSNSEGIIDPRVMKYVCEREISSGRMDPDDSFYELAISGQTIGDPSTSSRSLKRAGNRIAIGFTISAILFWVLGFREPVSPLWLILAGMILGTVVNSREQAQAKSLEKERRVRRGYPSF